MPERSRRSVRTGLYISDCTVLAYPNEGFGITIECALVHLWWMGNGDPVAARRGDSGNNHYRYSIYSGNLANCAVCGISIWSADAGYAERCWDGGVQRDSEYHLAHIRWNLDCDIPFPGGIVAVYNHHRHSIWYSAFQACRSGPDAGWQGNHLQA